jgi:hypothetical protein
MPAAHSLNVRVGVPLTAKIMRRALQDGNDARQIHPPPERCIRD